MLIHKVYEYSFISSWVYKEAQKNPQSQLELLFSVNTSVYKHGCVCMCVCDTHEEGVLISSQPKQIEILNTHKLIQLSRRNTLQTMSVHKTCEVLMLNKSYLGYLVHFWIPLLKWQWYCCLYCRMMCGWCNE